MKVWSITFCVERVCSIILKGKKIVQKNGNILLNVIRYKLLFIDIAWIERERDLISFLWNAFIFFALHCSVHPGTVSLPHSLRNKHTDTHLTQTTSCVCFSHTHPAQHCMAGLLLLQCHSWHRFCHTLYQVWHSVLFCFARKHTLWCVQSMGLVLVNIMTGHCCQHFLCLWFMSSCQWASPFICHDGTSFTKEPAIIAEGYLMCQCFPYMHSAVGFSAPSRKKTTKKARFVSLISRANGEFKLHTVKALHPLKSIIIVIIAICIISTSHRLSWVTEILVILFKGCNRWLIEPGWS